MGKEYSCQVFSFASSRATTILEYDFFSRHSSLGVKIEELISERKELLLNEALFANFTNLMIYCF